MTLKQGRFTAWFIEQFGPRPSELPIYDLLREIEQQESKLNGAKEMYRRTLQWETQYYAALKGYTAYEYITNVLIR